MDAVIAWLTANLLTIAATSVAIAFTIVMFLLLRPDLRAVPLSRRRPLDGPNKRTALSATADALTRGVDRALARRGNTLAERLDIAGVRLPLSNIIVLTASAVIVMIAASLLMNAPAMAVLSVPVIPLAVIAWVALRMQKRRSNFATQLDETSQMLAGSLRSGYSFPQAMLTVGKEAASPTAEEFTRMSNELRVGRPLADTMEHTAKRMQSDDFSWIAQAVAINREVGGNLADVLDGVSHTIRQRAQLRRQVAALSSEGRLSAIILIALPFVMVALLSVVNPTYIGLLVVHPLGWGLIIVGTLLLVAGALWLRSTVRIKF